MLSEREIDNLLGDVCVRLGFCDARYERSRFESRMVPDVRTFTDAVIVAEGLEPDAVSRELYRQVRDMVAEAFRREEYPDA